MIAHLSRRLNSPITVFLILIVASLGTGYGLLSARASHNDPNVIHLCVSKWTHQIRYVSTPAKCTDGQVIDINKQGAPGPQGPTGPAGMDGQPGVTDFVIRASTASVPPASGTSTVVPCLAGEVATGGGYSMLGPLLITYNGPSDDPTTGEVPTTWEVIAINESLTLTIDMTVWAICASV